MTVICEECGKVYHLDPDKLERYRGQSIRVRCGECGHVTQLSRLMETTELPEETYSEPSYATADAPPEDAGDAGLSPGQPDEEEPLAVAGGPDYSGGDSSSGGWIGLRGKMFFLFLVIPVVLMAASGYFSYLQIDKLTTEITDQSTELVAEAGQEQLLQKAQDVAVQCEIYLRTHPELEREDFSYDPTFNQIAVQAVGESGYTCLIEEETANRDAIIWAHPNPNLIGIPDIDTLRKALGPYFEGFYEILENSWGRNVSTGTYMWKDADGALREKYMAIVPINIEGKNFSLLATAYMDEFTERTEGLRENAEQMTMETRNINLGILGGSILIIGFCIIVYGYRLTRKIRYLTEAADRISVGDLEAEIEVRSKDEIGSLAEAISRMQDSLRFSIERLRRRR
ncbi:MAG: zinc-ribbon domain-containing protein [Desulfobacterales bacterium]|nr:zinc-ribbon domain-containing protein [Desulfobacterales bacterium]